MAVVTVTTSTSINSDDFWGPASQSADLVRPDAPTNSIVGDFNTSFDGITKLAFHLTGSFGNNNTYNGDYDSITALDLGTSTILATVTFSTPPFVLYDGGSDLDNIYLFRRLTAALPSQNFAGADTMTGNAGNDTLTGYAGNDLLDGMAGNDSLSGGVGNDTMDGGLGADAMLGGTGNDTYFVDNPGDVVTENTGEGTDTVHTTINYALTANVENLILDGAGNLTGTGNTLNNVLTGNAGNNSLYGGDGNDTASGGDGNDILVMGNGNDSADGGNGNDYFYAGAGNDILTGGAGLDVLEGEDGNDSIYGGTGFNYLFGGAGNDLLLGSGGSAASDVNVMYGGDGNDSLYGGVGTNYFYGGTGVDTMFGGSGENLFISSGETDGNFIYGGSGQNYVYGSNGGDTVTGGTNVDVFLMGSGNDNITGGGGTDYAWGGGGSDTFNMNDAHSDVMVIQDFNTGGVNDFLNFAGTSLHSFADVQAAEFYAAGINTTIITDAAGNADWLIGIAPTQLDASMFKFS